MALLLLQLLLLLPPPLSLLALLLRVLQDESRGTLRMHRGLIAAITAELQSKMAYDSDGGREITREEMREAMLMATSSYQLAAIEAIAAELQRD